ncbi:MAG TPA: hypothetical protein DCM28_09685 [Phycisphaerales bacterium]|nr:hypothetical protein [Phycisphaerales bacterium]HCD32620.1 hypothetical protein [Phycisphaerales bacterium]
MSRFYHSKNYSSSTWMAGCWLWLCLSVVLYVLTSSASADSSTSHMDEFEPFSFVLLGDPQIGYGNGQEMGSYQRFIDQARILNSLPTDFVIMPGDLVHSNNPYQWRLFMQGLKQYDKQTFLIPGNHDVQSLLDLQRYRDRLGDDYYDFVVRNCAFVMINSEIARDTVIDVDEHIQHWRWLEKTLEEHALAGRRHIFLVMHRPLYLYEHDEKSANENWPKASRSKLMKLIEKYNVTAILAGHLHQTTQMQLHNSEANAYTVGGTSKLWDKNGHGYRWFKVDQTGIHQEYQVFKPSEPKYWGFAGINGYVPEIVKMDMVQYGIIGLYVLTLLLCVRTWRHWRYIKHKRTARYWGGVTLCMLFLTINQAMSLNELCLIMGWQLDYLPNHGVGGVMVPLALVVLLLAVTSGALAVYFRHYASAVSGWITLYAITAGVAQFIVSLTTYDPWFSWQGTIYWQATLALTSLVVCFTAVASANTASHKVRPPAKLSRPRQIQKQPVRPQTPVAKSRPAKPKVRVKVKAKPSTSSQPRPTQKKLVTDAFLAAQFRSGRR